MVNVCANYVLVGMNKCLKGIQMMNIIRCKCLKSSGGFTTEPGDTRLIKLLNLVWETNT